MIVPSEHLRSSLAAGLLSPRSVCLPIQGGYVRRVQASAYRSLPSKDGDVPRGSSGDGITAHPEQGREVGARQQGEAVRDKA